MKHFLLILFLIMMPCFAAQDYYSFDTIEQKNRFEYLTTRLRCLVCQNQTIAESNAGLANDLRQQIYEKINNGHSDKEIIDYLIARYGDYILYQPPFNISTWGLWLGPFLFLIVCLGYLIFYLRKSHHDRTV